MLHHLASAADAWDSLGRPESELYRGVRLVRTLDWQGRTRSTLTETEHDFLEAARRNPDRVACIGMLQAQDGVVPTLMRTVMRTLRTLMQGRLNTIIEYDLEVLAHELARDHTDRTGLSISSNELMQAIAEVRLASAQPVLKNPAQ